MRETIVRLGLVLGGLALGLAVLEGGLRLAAQIAPAVLLRTGTAHDDGRLRIACVGDSHVYGAFLPARAGVSGAARRGVLRRRGVRGRRLQLRRTRARTRSRVRPPPAAHPRAGASPRSSSCWSGHSNDRNLSERGVGRARTRRASVESWRDLRLARLLQVLRVSVRDGGAAAARRPELRLVEQTARGRAPAARPGRRHGAGRHVARRRASSPPEEAERVTREDLAAIADGHPRRPVRSPVLLAYPAVLRPGARRRAARRSAATGVR